MQDARRSPQKKVDYLEKAIGSRLRTAEAFLYSFQVRVLIYEEDGEFVAHALEMDLLGYGNDEKGAAMDLADLIDSQISFAREQNDDSLLLFPAPKELFERWEKAHLETLRSKVFGDKCQRLDVKAVAISLDRLDRRSRRRFQPDPEHSCA